MMSGNFPSTSVRRQVRKRVDLCAGGPIVTRRHLLSSVESGTEIVHVVADRRSLDRRSAECGTEGVRGMIGAGWNVLEFVEIVTAELLLLLVRIEVVHTSADTE